VALQVAESLLDLHALGVKVRDSSRAVRHVRERSGEQPWCAVQLSIRDNGCTKPIVRSGARAAEVGETIGDSGPVRVTPIGVVHPVTGC
jgi:hypothetical protein